MLLLLLLMVLGGPLCWCVGECVHSERNQSTRGWWSRRGCWMIGARVECLLVGGLEGDVVFRR